MVDDAQQELRRSPVGNPVGSPVGNQPGQYRHPAIDIGQGRIPGGNK